MSRGLAIVGCGKMGRLIEQLAPECGFDVRAKFTRADNLHVAGITSESLRGVDVALEFTSPDAAPDNLRRIGRGIGRGEFESHVHPARCRARQSAPPCFSWNQYD